MMPRFSSSLNLCLKVIGSCVKSSANIVNLLSQSNAFGSFCLSRNYKTTSCENYEVKGIQHKIEQEQFAQAGLWQTCLPSFKLRLRSNAADGFLLCTRQCLYSLQSRLPCY